MRGKPNLPAYWPNGQPGPDIEYGDNPVVIGTPATGYDRDGRNYVQGTLGMDFKVPAIPGLSFRGNASYDVRFRNEKAWRTPWTLYTWDYKTRDANGQPVLQAAKRGYSTPQLNQYDGLGVGILLNLVGEYRRQFGPHTVGVLGGAERQTADSSYDSFFRDHVPLFDDLKLRVSWGKTGNDRIEAWQYLPTYGFGAGYVFGGNQVVPSIFQTRIPNPNITWEVAKQLDVGLEGRLLNNRLSFEFDRFTERRSNILAFRNASVPQTAAIPLPLENIGVVANQGYDGSITWQQQVASDVSF